MKELIINQLEDWEAAAAELLNYGRGKNIFVFSGEIGAGKTTFIQAICRQLGVEESVTSPTFALVNEYYNPADPDQTIYHLDLYRLKSLEEAQDIGIEDLLYDSDYCFVEWPDLIAPLLEQEKLVRIEIEIVKDSTRKVLFL